ncbi:Rootletin [Liparis tanakae]|uniref:Rootletin n=1 Tax=Liparis tanakae TaxID=230148 RepID=A0A4Z2J5U2_9TELE|nr:Rootletin [Liparis tanakae]
MLREQLEQAGLANEALSQDIRKLTTDWTKAREELEQKESDWRREEESFHSYFSTEHSRLLMLWRQVVGFRRHVCEMKSATERDLSDMRNEMARASHSAQLSCAGLSATLHTREAGAALVLEREKALQVQLEQQLRERVGEMMNLQTRTDAERSELNVRLSESVREAERLKGHIEERDREMVALMRRLEEQSGNDETEMQAMRAHTETLLDTLRDIAQTVMSDGESSSEADQDNSGAPLLALIRGFSHHRSSSSRGSSSPSRASSLAPLSEAALSALRSAVTNKTLHLQVTCQIIGFISLQ